MSTSNPWLTPFQRSYDQIKSKLIENLKINVPEISDFSAGNIFILIISIFASVAEVLHYYIDNMARESFFVTARRYTSLIKHSAMVDYHIRSAIPAQVDIYLSLSSGNPITYNVEIPLGQVFRSKNDIPFISTKTIVFKKGSYGVLIPCVQKEKRDNILFGNVPAGDIIAYLGDLGDGLSYAEGSMVLKTTLNDVVTLWELVETFAYSKSDSKHYKIELDSNYTPYLKFGDNLYGAKPTVNSLLTGSFYVTRGSFGNLPVGNINSVPSVISLLISEGVSCTNLKKSTGGSNYEDFDMIREHVPLSIKTLGVAITKEDYEDMAKLMPGVDKAKVDYISGKFLDIYITPDGGGEASQGLLEDTYLAMLRKKVMGTTFNVFAAKEVEINLSATITGKKSFKRNDISEQVISALQQAYSYNTSDIRKPIRLSDLYALIDNLPIVDYLKIDNLYLQPTVYILTSDTVDINKTLTIASILTPKTYILRYAGLDTFHLLWGNNLPTGIELTVGVTKSIITDNNSFQLNVGNPLAGSYSIGNMWKFTVSANNVDQLPESFSIPIFGNSPNITLNIIETV